MNEVRANEKKLDKKSRFDIITDLLKKHLFNITTQVDLRGDSAREGKNVNINDPDDPFMKFLKDSSLSSIKRAFALSYLEYIFLNTISGETRIICSNSNITELNRLIEKTEKGEGCVLSDLSPIFKELTPFVLRKKLYDLEIIKKNSDKTNKTLRFNADQLKRIRKKIIKEPDFFKLKNSDDIDITFKINKRKFFEALADFKDTTYNENSKAQLLERELQNEINQHTDHNKNTVNSILLHSVQSKNNELLYANYFIKKLENILALIKMIYEDDESLNIGIDSLLGILDECLPVYELPYDLENESKMIDKYLQANLSSLETILKSRH